MSPRRQAKSRRVVARPAVRTGRAASVALSVLLVVGLVGCSEQAGDEPSAEQGEVWLTSAEDPGHDPFMPSVASPPQTADEPLPGPEIAPQGDGTELVAQQQSGDRSGLYGGSLDHAECDPDKMVAFLQSHPAEAQAFVEALNADSTLKWSQGAQVSVDQIAAYVGELTPVVLRVDTRVTNHGFDGAKPIPLQSVLQAGTAVLVDAYGVPRVRCSCGNPLTAPIAFDAKPKPVGTPWPDYNPGAVVVVQPSMVVIRVFVLVDIYTGATFERVAGTIAEDTVITIRTDPTPLDPPQAQPGGDLTRYDGSWVVSGLPSPATMVIRDGRLVTITELDCVITVQADFVISESPGGFSGPFSTSTSGPSYCQPWGGSISGEVVGAGIIMTVTGASGAPVELQLSR